MKKYKITFWVTTVIIFLMEGLIPAFTSQSQMAIDGVTHLGYPVYFSGMLAAFKFLGACALIIPKVSARIKEWAYAGFGIDFLSAFISIWAVDGFGPVLLFPAVFIVILALSYNAYQKLNTPFRV